MSRSNPTERIQNPASPFHLEWRGSAGEFRYWDKSRNNGEGENVVMKSPFVFIFLDQLATIKGYNKKKGGMYSNEIRDTRDEILVVKFFNGGTVAEGLYKDIRDRIIVEKGHYVTNCYAAFRHGEELKICAVQFQGCSLGPWIEFFKENRKAIEQEKAVKAVRGEMIKEGDDIEFYPPVFSLVDIKPETNEQAKELDRQLQAYLKLYFSKTKSAQVEHGEEAQPDAEPEIEHEPAEANDVPF